MAKAERRPRGRRRRTVLGKLQTAGSRARVRALTEQLAAAAARRQCGACHACCVHVGVPELHKAPGVRCERLADEGGCSQYDERPESCQTYRCTWRQGWLDDSDRPDLLGVLIETRDTFGGNAVLCRQLRDLDEDAVRALIDRIVGCMPLPVLYIGLGGGHLHVHGERERVDRFQARFRDHLMALPPMVVADDETVGSMIVWRCAGCGRVADRRNTLRKGGCPGGGCYEAAELWAVDQLHFDGRGKARVGRGQPIPLAMRAADGI